MMELKTVLSEVAGYLSENILPFSALCLALIILHFYSSCSLAVPASNTYEACPGERIMNSEFRCIFLISWDTWCRAVENSLIPGSGHTQRWPGTAPASSDIPRDFHLEHYMPQVEQSLLGWSGSFTVFSSKSLVFKQQTTRPSYISHFQFLQSSPVDFYSSSHDLCTTCARRLGEGLAKLTHL